MSDVFDGMDVMDSLVFLMVLDTALGLANGTGTGTSDTRADLDTFAVVEFTN
jgi:hypothetical protein